MLLLPDRAARDRILQRLWRAGAGISRLFARALPDYESTAFLVDDPLGCPRARDLADRLLTVTNTHWLDEGGFSRILEQIRRVL
jgi:hypothetical protein